MKRTIFFILLFLLPILLSCSREPLPVCPNQGADPATDLFGRSDSSRMNTCVWGFYIVTIDTDSLSAVAVPLRNALFTANVVNFLNSNPASMGLHVNSVVSGSDNIDIDLDVSLTHPFPGLPQYNGYDVRGVVIGNGTASLSYDPEIILADYGNRIMLPDPLDGSGGPDGYTRWFNPSEFGMGTAPIFKYTKGKFASDDFSASATLNPYAYFSDDIGVNEVVWDFLTSTDQPGRFSSGSTCTRNYYLRFPGPGEIKFCYAVLADWAGVDEHPAYSHEAIACSITDSESTVYYVDQSNNGGSMVLDISIWDHDSEIEDGIMKDYTILIESSVLQNVYTAGPDIMAPVGGGLNFSTYHIEIAADNVNILDDNEYWVIIEQEGYDYSNPYGVPNAAQACPLASFFRFDLEVSSQAPPSESEYTCTGSPVPYDADYECSDTAQVAEVPAAFMGSGGPYDLGFTFSYAGVDYTQIRINENGGLFLGDNDGPGVFAWLEPQYGPCGENYDWEYYCDYDFICGMGCDLAPEGSDDGNSSPCGQILYETGEVNGTQVFIVEWKEVCRWPYPYEAQETFQIILYDDPAETWDRFRLQWKSIDKGNEASSYDAYFRYGAAGSTNDAVLCCVTDDPESGTAVVIGEG